MMRMTEKTFRRLKRSHRDMTVREALPGVGEEVLAAVEEVKALRKEVHALDARLNNVMARVIKLEMMIACAIAEDDGRGEA